MMHFLDMFGDNGVDKTTSALASAAVASPIWLPFLHSVSDVATLCLPILGAAWLIVQIIGYFLRGK